MICMNMRIAPDIPHRLDDADVALVLSQIGPVFAGPGEQDSAVVNDRVQRDYIKRMFLQHEQGEGKDSDDDS